MKWKNYLLPTMALLFLLLNVLYPVQAIAGAKKGLQLFLQSVLPAMLPFFAATSMLIRTGLAHKLAKLLSPLMRPLFRLPGASALAFVFACCGGNPNGSRATSELYEEGLLTKPEAERTIALASTAGPAFILSVVAGEMLKAPQYGMLLWGCHILSAIATCQLSSLLVTKHADRESRKKTAQNAVHQGPSQIFVESVRDCAVSLWGIGAFIIFFSTLAALCQSVHAFALLAKPFSIVLKPLGFSPQLAEPLINGIMEITEGCSAICALSIPVIQKVPVLCAVISFGGLSALAQNHMFARKCGIRISRLTLYYTIQGILGLFFCTIAVRVIPLAQTAYAPVPHAFDSMLFNSGSWLIAAIAILLGLGAILSLLSLLFGRHNRRHLPIRVKT